MAFAETEMRFGTPASSLAIAPMDIRRGRMRFSATESRSARLRRPWASRRGGSRRGEREKHLGHHNGEGRIPPRLNQTGPPGDTQKGTTAEPLRRASPRPGGTPRLTPLDGVQGPAFRQEAVGRDIDLGLGAQP
jgi:hypothetical protein